MSLADELPTPRTDQDVYALAMVRGVAALTDAVTDLTDLLRSGAAAPAGQVELTEPTPKKGPPPPKKGAK